jgi:Fe-Mn family superoxide dismutase
MTTRRELLSASVPAFFLGGAFAPSAIAAAGHRVFQDEDKLGRVFGAMWDGNQYLLPPLPYDYNSLEPHIDEQTMRLHHDKHHQAYVTGLNSTTTALKELGGQETIEDARLSGLQRNLSFHYGGHVMHSVFWATLGPPRGAGNEPAGELANAIKLAYGSFENFKRLFKATAAGVKGSGWAVLLYDAVGDRLYVKAMNDQDAYFPPGALPVLPLDVWEHAYYLKYQNNRGAYIDAWWNVVDWPTTDALYRVVRQMMQAS